jgi:hypothetical protein
MVLLIVTNASAQNNISIKGDTLILNNHAKFWINEEVVFGQGTMPNKSYSYIYEAPNSLQKIINNHKRKLLSRGHQGYKSKVVKFEKEIGRNKKEYNYSIIVLETPEGKRYWCDVANAFNNQEIQFRTDESNVAQQKDTDANNNNSADVNAELSRLKKLLDDGSISQDQYDLLKKKLLDSQKTSSTSKRPKTTKAKPVTIF